MPGSAAILANIQSRSSFRREKRSPPIGLASTPPVRRNRSTHLPTVLWFKPYCAATSRQDEPACTAEITRARKSAECGKPLLRFEMGSSPGAVLPLAGGKFLKLAAVRFIFETGSSWDGIDGRGRRRSVRRPSAKIGRSKNRLHYVRDTNFREDAATPASSQTTERRLLNPGRACCKAGVPFRWPAAPSVAWQRNPSARSA